MASSISIPILFFFCGLASGMITAILSMTVLSVEHVGFLFLVGVSVAYSLAVWNSGRSFSTSLARQAGAALLMVASWPLSLLVFAGILAIMNSLVSAMPLVNVSLSIGLGAVAGSLCVALAMSLITKSWESRIARDMAAYTCMVAISAYLMERGIKESGLSFRQTLSEWAFTLLLFGLGQAVVSGCCGKWLADAGIFSPNRAQDTVPQV